MRMLYKYPQAEFPYEYLIEENRRRGRQAPEFELLDTGVFAENRYFDVLVEYAKADVEDILIRITVSNRGPEAATLHVLPQVWFRNTWSWAGICGARSRARPRTFQALLASSCSTASMASAGCFAPGGPSFCSRKTKQTTRGFFPEGTARPT